MSTKKDAEAELAQSLALRFGVPAINLADIAIDRGLIRHVPVDVARRHQLLPIRGDAASLTVAMADPGDRSGIDTLRRQTGLRIEVMVAPRTTLMRTIERFYFAN
jgi:type IV pilus assembly protein PilB